MTPPAWIDSLLGLLDHAGGGLLDLPEKEEGEKEKRGKREKREKVKKEEERRGKKRQSNLAFRLISSIC